MCSKLVLLATYHGLYAGHSLASSKGGPETSTNNGVSQFRTPCRLRIHVASNLHPDLGPAARSEPVLSLECGAVAQPTA